MKQQIKIYNSDKTINAKIMYMLINVILDDFKVDNDKVLADYIKKTINAMGLNVYSVYCYGNTKKFVVKVASKVAVFTDDQALTIVSKLIKNRKSNTQA